jgi:hypothetical protein
MKTAYSLIVGSIFALVLFYGIGLINTQSLTNQAGNLDDESLNVIGLYDTQYANFSENFNSTTISTDEPDVSKADTYFKEYTDLKTRFDQLRDAMNLIYKIPDIIVVSLTPFYMEDIKFYMGIVKFMLIVLISVAIYKGLAAKQVTED